MNSQKSTGPRSAEGKAASSQNALKSGVPSGPDSQSQIIRGEDPTVLDALAAQYLLDHQPQSAVERALDDILIDSEWLLRRLRKTEAHLWEYQLAGIEGRPEDEILGRAFQNSQQTFARLERRRDTLQRAYHRTLHDLRQIQNSRAQVALQPDAPQPAAVPPAPTHPTPSSQKANPENGFVPENPQNRPAGPAPADPLPSPNGSPACPPVKLAPQNNREQPPTALRNNWRPRD